MTTATNLSELTGDYVIDAAHSRIGFVARHAMVTKVRGAFNEFDGKISIDGDNPAATSAQVVLKVASIDTRQAQRDEHLRNNDFLAADQYPEIKFVSTAAEQIDETTFRLTGDLTIKDVTRGLSIDFTFEGVAKDPFGNTRVGFEGSTTINRKDFGVTWNAALETGGVLVGEKVVLEFEISAIKS
ncbi:polyisoprenoid-binding protein [Lentzea tibetensis]|uniref:Polyisoprenoid-binding protein n=1 Tax=Lentzea tibetensis TaxID=2591470 RepID=A0A563EJH1_9PSEU|nr:YceI family protein [Lentzea tibetensis]TWP46900.1 polyisoprenoid-binding protein [Lentzea tibetensis]